MGRIAFVLADTINEQHQLGIDLEGNLGKNFLMISTVKIISPREVFAHEGNAPPNDRKPLAEVVDSGELTTRDYTVHFTGPLTPTCLSRDAYTGRRSRGEN